MVVLLLPVVLTACGDDQDAYCDAVSEHQQELSELIGSTDPDALLQAVPIFEDLRDRAPSDIEDEWQALISGITALGDTMSSIGVDPDTYDPTNPPPDVTPEEQKAIRAASRRLTAPETLQALKDIDQQVRDVCHTPLTL